MHFFLSGVSLANRRGDGTVGAVIYAPAVSKSDGRPVRKIIWNGRNENPIPYVSQELAMDPFRCSDALHQIKQAGGLGPQDATIIYDNGDVVDALNGEEIGNLYDEN